MLHRKTGFRYLLDTISPLYFYISVKENVTPLTACGSTQGNISPSDKATDARSAHTGAPLVRMGVQPPFHNADLARFYSTMCKPNASFLLRGCVAFG